MDLMNCRFCDFKSPFKLYLPHLESHRHISKKFPCGVLDCDRTSETEAALRSHIINFHNIFVRQHSDRSNLAALNREGKFVCTSRHCEREFPSFSFLMKHFKSHITAGLKVLCPYPSCSRGYDVLSSLTGHISRDHKNDPEPTQVLNSFQEDPPLVDNSFQERNFNYVDGDVGQFDHDCSVIPVNTTNDKQWLDSFAQFYMRLEHQCLIPESTVQYISEELHFLQKQNMDMISKKLETCLAAEGVPTDNISNILKTCIAPAMKPIETLSSSYRRKKYYKQSFEYVRPVKQTLGRNKFFYYVPVKKTLLASFKNKSVVIELSKPAASDDGVLKDFTDGLAFKRNKFFNDNPNALRLILFQDAFQIVCPIGFAKKKYKILAVYLCIGNLPDYLRSHVKSFQLIALCKDDELDHKLLFGKIMQDLLDLEENGIYVPGVGLVKAGLAFIAGDNLGSHGVGGFYENFSKTIYFCRFCTVDRASFYTKDGPFLKYPRRTPESYTECLSGDTIISKKGVKFDSEFNKLSSFHVCEYGLPPCYAHDVYEGFAKYDFALFIHSFVSKEWFTYDDLNECIGSFPYSEAHRRDKPQPFEETFKSVKGKAWSIHNFILLFPLIMKNFIVNEEDKVWKCLLLLVEIIEILCSPEIHISYLPYLEGLIYDYIESRRQLFPRERLRPKHHYFTHYAELILWFGPLMRVWTMRFESKHCFFCRAAKFSRQFKNILLSLSVRHELHQAFIRCGSNTFAMLQFTKTKKFLFEAYCAEIQQAVKEAGLSSPIQVCCKTTFKGTKYCKGKILALEQQYYQEDVVFGRITLILIARDETLFFLVETLRSEFVPHLRAFRLLGSCALKYKCVSYNDLLSYSPMHNYKVHGGSFVRLKHGLISKPL